MRLLLNTRRGLVYLGGLPGYINMMWGPAHPAHPARVHELHEFHEPLMTNVLVTAGPVLGLAINLGRTPSGPTCIAAGCGTFSVVPTRR